MIRFGPIEKSIARSVLFTRVDERVPICVLYIIQGV